MLKVPSELPVDVNGFKSQQYRWAKGAVQTGRKLLGQVWRAPIPLKVKFEALVHLTNNASYPLMVLLSLLIFPAMMLRRGSPVALLFLVDLPLFLSATVAVLTFYLMSQVAGNDDWRREMRYLPALMSVGIGLSVNNARAVISGLFHQGGTFIRTPKYRIEKAGQSWSSKRYRAGTDPTRVVEGLLALYFLGGHDLRGGGGDVDVDPLPPPLRPGVWLHGGPQLPAGVAGLVGARQGGGGRGKAGG